MNSFELELSMLKQQIKADFGQVSEHINRLYGVIEKQFEVIKSLDARLDNLECAKTEAKSPVTNRIEGVEL